jgi:hypothetical protein
LWKSSAAMPWWKTAKGERIAFIVSHPVLSSHSKNFGQSLFENSNKFIIKKPPSPNIRLCDVVVPPRYLIENTNLLLNNDYYINHMILPPLSRMFFFFYSNIFEFTSFSLLGLDIYKWWKEAQFSSTYTNSENSSSSVAFHHNLFNTVPLTFRKSVVSFASDQELYEVLFLFNTNYLFFFSILTTLIIPMVLSLQKMRFLGKF